MSFAIEFRDFVQTMKARKVTRFLSPHNAKVLQLQRMQLKMLVPENWEKLTIEEHKALQGVGDKIRTIEKRLIDGGYGFTELVEKVY